MLLKMLGATAAVAVIVIGYMVFSVPMTAVFNQLNAIFPTVTLNGVSMSDFTHNQFLLYSAAVVISLVCVAVYLIAAANSEENDSGSFF